MARKTLLLALLGVVLGLATVIAEETDPADDAVTVTLLRWPYT